MEVPVLPPAVEDPLPPRRRSRARMEGRGRRLPVVALTLAAINLAVALVLQGHGLEYWVKTLERFGHLREAVWDGEYWRLLTCMFLHGGFWHLGLNVLALTVFGSFLEPRLGSWRFLKVYFLSGLSGVVFYQAFSGLGGAVGASGAVCGLPGILLVGLLGRHDESGVVLGRRFWLWTSLAVVVLVAEAFFARAAFHSLLGAQIEVALSAHLGGFFCGLLLGYYYFTPKRARKIRRRTRLLLGGSLVALGVYGFVAPVFDWTWYLWQAKAVAEDGDEELLDQLYRKTRQLGGDRAAAKIVGEKVRRGRVDEALEYWNENPLEDPAEHRIVGFVEIYDALEARDQGDEKARQVLDGLIELVDAALEEDRSPENLNEAAWYRAMREEDLETALEYASEAVRREPRAANFINTLGWVEFLRKDYKPAIEHLGRAVELLPIGPNFLYLALAHYRTKAMDPARAYAVEARRAGGLLEHEEKLLAWLEESLASG